MKSRDEFSLRNILPSMQSPHRGRTSHSHAYAGHEDRMAAHQARVHSHQCECGSGLAYGDCCIGRINQDYLELSRRAKEAGHAIV